mmetsp:Transcript_5872/g.16461  ORF Transcript_5872/g.16461 Transcript_5872/m.16461 type:complete len:417 (+) Transcript_5872:303-1553(+)
MTSSFLAIAALTLASTCSISPAFRACSCCMSSLSPASSSLSCNNSWSLAATSLRWSSSFRLLRVLSSLALCSHPVLASVTWLSIHAMVPLLDFTSCCSSRTAVCAAFRRSSVDCSVLTIARFFWAVFSAAASTSRSAARCLSTSASSLFWYSTSSAFLAAAASSSRRSITVSICTSRSAISSVLSRFSHSATSWEALSATAARHPSCCASHCSLASTMLFSACLTISCRFSSAAAFAACSRWSASSRAAASNASSLCRSVRRCLSSSSILASESDSSRCLCCCSCISCLSFISRTRSAADTLSFSTASSRSFRSRSRSCRQYSSCSRASKSRRDCVSSPSRCSNLRMSALCFAMRRLISGSRPLMVISFTSRVFSAAQESRRIFSAAAQASFCRRSSFPHPSFIAAMDASCLASMD